MTDKQIRHVPLANHEAQCHGQQLSYSVMLSVSSYVRYHVFMRLLGNILWLILGGLCLAVGWAVIGLVLCVTIVGIPLGVQAFKMAGLTLTPFGKTVVYGGGVGSMLLNIVWLALAGVWMAIGYVFAGLLNCVTIIGIPFGIQSFKMAKLALWPFGSQIL